LLIDCLSADPETGETCDFSKCSFNKAFENAEKKDKDEMMAACKASKGLKATDSCLKSCKVKTQVDTLVDLGAASASSCADTLMQILEMEVQREEDADDEDEAEAEEEDEEEQEAEEEDEEEADENAQIAAAPHFGCLIGCKAKVKGETASVTKATLPSLGCMDWPPMLMSVKGEKCISKCTISTKWAIGNATAANKTACDIAAKEEAEQEKADKEQAKETDELSADYSCLVGCTGTKGKKLTSDVRAIV
jgi:hypothetical protein